MARLFSLIRSLLGFLLAAPCLAFACYQVSGVSATFNTKNEACAASFAANSAVSGSSVYVGASPDGSACIAKNPSTNEEFAFAYTSYTATCPDKCVSSSDLGGAGTSWSYDGNYPGYGGYCIGGCSYALYGYEGYDAGSGKSAARGVMKAMKTSCTSVTSPITNDNGVNTVAPSTAPTGSSPDVSACSNGLVPYKGTVNGKSVTVCGSPTKTSSTDTTTSSSSGSTTKNVGGTKTTTGNSSTGSETKTTTCADGKCTTTTTKNDTTGGGSNVSGGTSTTGTETKTVPQVDYCKDNPRAAVCSDSQSSFGGSCGAYSCQGDAVQCAQARAANELLCKVDISDTDPHLIAGQSAANGGATPSGHPRNDAETSDFALASMIDSSPLFGSSGECIADKTVPMLGKTLTLPFSRMCTALELLGAAFLACCYISAAYIVFNKG